MSNSWDDMRKAKEDSYFAKKESEALARLAAKKGDPKPRLSPVSGEPMEQVVMHGVVVDRCPSSGGIWLDAGELEQLLELSRSESEAPAGGWLASFVHGLSGKK